MRNLTFGFVGIGLIGGSVAKSIRRTMPDSKIIVYNRSDKSCEMALLDGTANAATDSVNDIFNECDYIFLCTPVEQNTKYLSVLKDIIKDDCIFTDVGSVKTNIHEEVKKVGLEENFIGGHPMAGSEKTGYENATDRLLENAYYAITPTDKTPQDKIDEFTEIVKTIGAIPINISYEEHDKVVATISHLPHLVASSLVNLVKDNDSEKEYMKTMAAGGFKDITRIASSSPDMWDQICMTNNTNISIMLGKYIDSLSEIKDVLDEHKEGAVYDLISKSKDYRDNIDNRNNGMIDKSYRIYCDIVDESGAIATIATTLATNGISLKNIGIVHNREFEEGVLRISFYNEEAADKAAELLEKHNYNIYKRS